MAKKSFVSFVLTLVMGLGVIFGATACNPTPDNNDRAEGSDRVVDDNPTTNSQNTVISPVKTVNGDKFEYDFASTTAVGFSAKVLGTVERRRLTFGLS